MCFYQGALKNDVYNHIYMSFSLHLSYFGNILKIIFAIVGIKLKNNVFSFIKNTSQEIGIVIRSFYIKMTSLFIFSCLLLNILETLRLFNGMPMNKFFKSPKPPLSLKNLCINNDIIEGRSYYNSNVNISECMFIRFQQFSQKGAVIYISDGVYTLFVSFSMFINCASLSDGGAIYFSSYKSMQKMICSFNCSSSSNGQYAYLYATMINEAEYISISTCNLKHNGRWPFILYSGNQVLASSNTSICKAFHGSGISIYEPTSFNGLYCTFSSNSVIDGICISFWSSSGLLSFSNVIQNNSPSLGVVRNYGGIQKIEYCIFNLNTGALFNVQSGSLHISHNYISHLGVSLTSNNNSMIETQSYLFQFFSSHYCNADIPIISILSRSHNLNMFKQMTSIRYFELVTILSLV